MIAPPLRRAPTPIGLDLGPAHVAAAQLRRGRAGWGLVAAAVVPRAAPGPVPAREEAARLADALWRCGFRGGDVTLGVPDASLLVSAMDLPPRASGAPLLELARAELARAHKRDGAALEAALWDLPAPARAGSGTHAFAVACPHADAGALLDAFDAAALRVRALDARLLALARAGELAWGGGACDGPAAYADLGHEHALIAVVHRGVPVYQRVAPESGVGRLLEALAARLGVGADLAAHALWTIGTGCDPAERAEGMDRMEEARATVAAHLEALAHELRAVVDYVAHLYPDAQVRRLGLTGPGAAIPGVPAKLGFELGLRTQALAPAQFTQCPPRLADAARDPRLTVAAGLALALAAPPSRGGPEGAP